MSFPGPGHPQNPFGSPAPWDAAHAAPAVPPPSAPVPAAPVTYSGYGTSPNPWGPPGPAPQAPLNTFALLSAIVAVPLAPVGAALGHLGLAQIKRTGQRGRPLAVIGIILSYTMIAVLVASLLIWVNGRDAAETPNQASPTTTAAAAGPYTGPIDAPLLDVNGVLAVLNDPSGGLNVLDPVTDFVAQQPFTGPTPIGVQGSTTPDICQTTMFPGTEYALDGTGYTKVYGVTMRGTRQGVPTWATQFAVTYPDAATAQRAVDEYASRAARCRAESPTFMTTAADGSSLGYWSDTSDLEPFDGYYLTYRDPGAQQNTSRPDATPVPDKEFFTTRRIVAVKGATLIDVGVGGIGVYFQNLKIAEAIAAKLP